jgi:hypothetical protein
MPCCVVLCAVQEDMRETSLSELHYEDLEKLPPDDVTRVAEWLTEKVDALSSRLKAEQREDEVRPAAAVLVVWSGCGCAGQGVHTGVCRELHRCMYVRICDVDLVTYCFRCYACCLTAPGCAHLHL